MSEIQSDYVLMPLQRSASHEAINSIALGLSTEEHEAGNEVVELQVDQRERVAAAYVIAGAAGRAPNIRLENPEDFEQRMCMYKVVSSRPWKYWMHLVIWVHLLIVHWDDGLGARSMNAHKTSIAFVMVELVILAFYGLDFYLKYETHDRGNFCHEREDGHLCPKFGHARIFIGLVWIVLMDLFIFIGSGLTSVRFSILVRPGFLILKQRWVRHSFLSLMKSAKDLLLLGVFLAVPMLAYSFAGYALFSAESKTIFVIGVHVGNSTACLAPTLLCGASALPGNTYFASYKETLKSLMVLSTTSNFPDVMMQSYHHKPMSAAYFFSYSYLSCFLVMPIVFSMVYSNFQKFEREYAKELKCRVWRAIEMAFDLISETVSLRPVVSLAADASAPPSEPIERELRLHSAVQPEIEAHEDVEAPVLEERNGDEESETSERLAKLNRFIEVAKLCGCSEVHSRILFKASARDERGLTLEQFARIVEHFDLEYVLPNRVNSRSAQQLRNMSGRVKVEYFLEQYKSWVVYHHKIDAVQWMIMIVTLFSVFFVVMQLFSTARVWVMLSTISLWVFVVEKVLLFCAYGSNLPNMEIVDSTLVFSCVALKAFVQVMDLNPDFVLVFRVFVIVFVVADIPCFQNLVFTSGLVFKYAGSLFVMEFVVLYVFAFVGMLLFHGVLSHEVVLNEILSGNDVSYWQGVLSSFYYDNNFNTWWRSMVVVGELTMVNNWMVIYTMFLKLKGPHYLVYFYAVYIVSVLFTMNAIQSVVVDVFKLLHERDPSERWPGEDRIREELARKYPNITFGEDEIQFFRSPSQWQFYHRLYLDNWTQNALSDWE